jgi:hypothetical protein
MRYGYLSSIIILISGGGLIIGIVASAWFLPSSMTTGWVGVEAYAAAYRANGGLITSLSFLASLCLCPAYVLQIASINRLNGRRSRKLGALGLICAVVFAILAGLNYLIQLTVVRTDILAGQTSGIERLVFQNPNSFTLELDLVGWFLLSIAFLSMLESFPGGDLSKAVRFIIVANAAVGLAQISSLALSYLTICQVLLSVSSGVLTCLDVLLLVFFRRLLRVV